MLGSTAQLAFWIGLIMVGIWARADFNRGMQAGKIKYGSPRDRYFLGIATYSILMLFTYFVIVTTSFALSTAVFGVPTSVGYQTPVFSFSLILNANQWGALPSSLVGAALVIAILPEFPISKQWIAALRQFSRVIALYPHAVDRLTRLLAAARFRSPDDPGVQLSRELARYGASLDDLEQQLSSSTLKGILEAQSLRTSFVKLIEAWKSHPKSRGFLRARQEQFDIVERNYQKLVRRVARICDLKDALTYDGDDPYPLSEFAASRADQVLRQYRKLIAEAAVACFGSGARRRSFIQRFGYEPPPDWLLPYWPFLAIFFLDGALFVSPVVIRVIPVPLETPAVLFFMLGHGIAQVVAVSLAVFPKATSSFSRPSLNRLPLQSYLLFGTISYIAGLFLFSITSYVYATLISPGRVINPLNINTNILNMIFSSYFPALTVTISILIDLHLRNSSYRKFWYRLRDSATCGCIMAITNLFIRLLIWRLSDNWPPTWAFLYVATLLGVVVGALVPATAAYYLSATDEESAPRLPDFDSDVSYRAVTGRRVSQRR